MSLRNTIASGMMRAAMSLTGSAGWSKVSGWFGDGVSGKLNVPGLSEPAENVLWVYNCMTARSEAIMQAALRISDADDHIIESGPLVDLLSRPNEFMDGVQFLGAVESYLTIFNSAFIVPVAEEGARPNELILLPPQNMKPIRGVHTATGAEIPMGWEFNSPTGYRRTFTSNEIIVIQSFNPHNPLTAIDPMSALRRSMQMDIATREQNLAIFLNGGMPDVILSTDKKMDVDQTKEFLAHYNKNYSGFGKSHKAAMLANGVKLDVVGLNPEELQSIEVLKNLTPQEIVAGLRTKPVMAGLMVGESGLATTSVTEQKVAWWSETGFGNLARICSALQEFLVDPYDWSASGGRAMSHSERQEFARQSRRMRPMRRAGSVSKSKLALWFDTNHIPELMEYRWKRIQEYDRLAGRGYLPDDLNDYFDLGLPPHPTNIGTLPFSLQNVFDLASAPAASEDKPERTDPPRRSRSIELIDQLSTAIRTSAAATLQNVSPDVPAESGSRSDIPAKYKTLRRIFDAFLKPRQKATAKKFSRFYSEQRTRVLARLTALDTQRGDEDPISFNHTQADVLSAVFPVAEENSSLSAVLRPLVTSHLQDGFEFFSEHENAAGNVLSFNIDDPNIGSVIDARMQQASYVNDTTRDALGDMLKDSFEAGDTTAQLADRFDAYYREHCTGETKHRPLTAAQTQTSGIVNKGRLMAAEEVGGLDKGWLHGGSKEPRDAHVAAQSKYLESPIPLDAKFTVNGYECEAPGSTDLPVGEVAKCTCMVTFVKSKKED